VVVEEDESKEYCGGERRYTQREREEAG